MSSLDSASAGGRLGPPHLIVISASRGGLDALSELLQKLPGDLAAAVVIVQHMAPLFRSRLPEILNSRTALNVQTARQGSRLEAGHVYVAPPDQHVIITRQGHIRLSTSVRVNFTRPAVDPLFSSAAEHFRDRVIAVVLTGSGKDGAQGAIAVEANGGIVLVQDEASSVDFGMGGATIASGCATEILPLDKIAARLITLTKV